jgi:predicted dehydrogenase
MNINFTRRDFIKTTSAAALAATVLPAWAQDEKKIVVAFVGVAHIHTPEYLKLVKQHAGTQIKYVWDHDADRAARRAKEVDAAVPTDLDVIWSDPEINAVIILSETNRHHDLVLAAAKAGKNIFAEKPLGITGSESREMAEAIEKAGVIFTTGYFMRTDPKHIFLKSEIAKGNFGVITRVRGSNCHNGSLGGWFDTEWRWMADPKIAGVGGFGDLGTHKLDILMWMFGDIESVTADIRPVTHRYGDCDETGEAMIRFESGVIGTLAAGWVDIADPVQLLISGTRGHAVIFNGQLYYKNEKVSGASGESPWTDLPPRAPEPMDQFLDAVGGAKDEPLVSPSEAAARVTVMEAMYKAARKREWVEIPD